ncbi:MAG: hypothetical protein IBX63_09640 [Coriobacteriia bacterium]|nr:hypothetical protein [Coriobacteriia bacterium]
MSGVHSEEYIVARRALLDAFDALERQRQALVLVGAQAIYLHTGSADLAVAEYTTDGDVVIDPRLLGDEPEIAAAMRTANFWLDERHGRQLVGVWASAREIGGVPATVTVDLLVPEAFGGSGRRAARIPPHERSAMLKVHGLEAALVDHSEMEIAALEDGDDRRVTVKVAGPAALLISKIIKVSERVRDGVLQRGRADRVKPKDALDVLRIMRAIPGDRLAAAIVRLSGDEVAGGVTREAVASLPALFATVESTGSLLAAEAAAPEPPDVIAASCAALCAELMGALRNAGFGNEG